MTDEKWEDLCERLAGLYPALVRFREDLEPGGKGTREVLEFRGPAGDMRVMRTSRPKVLEREFHYSHRAGDTARTEYKLSDTEMSHRVQVFRDQDGEWQEILLDDFSALS